MNRSAFPILAIIAAAIIAQAESPVIAIRTDVQRPQVEFQIRTASGSTPTIRAFLLNDGAAWTDTASVTGGAVYYYATNWPSTNWVAIPFRSVGSNYVDFVASAGDTATSGVFVAQVVLIATNQTLVWGRGTLTLDYVPPLLYGGTALNLNAQFSNYTNATALIASESNRAITAEGVLNAQGTNALFQIAAESNRAIQAEAGINMTATNAYNQATNALNIARLARDTATNALSIAQASLALATVAASPSTVTNIVTAWAANWAPTGSVWYADQAGGLSISNGSIRLRLTTDAVWFDEITNSLDVAVVSTNGSGFNGPPIGTTFTGATWDGNVWAWTPKTIGPTEYVLSTPDYDFLGSWALVFEGVQAGTFSGHPPLESLSASDGDASGSLRLSWVQVTNSVSVWRNTITGAEQGGVLMQVVNSVIQIPDVMGTNYTLALDSYGWTDYGAWIDETTNGNARDVSLGLYSGYAWMGCYSQYTNAQQGRVYVASIAAPPFLDVRLSSVRILYRALNPDDDVQVLIYDAGATAAFMTNDLPVTYSESVHELIVTDIDRPAGSGFTLQATAKTTALTDEGSWTALPRIEAIWSK